MPASDEGLGATRQAWQQGRVRMNQDRRSAAQALLVTHVLGPPLIVERAPSLLRSRGETLEISQAVP
jgi:hypothetical protein